ncbi:MAG: TlpA family protein disulfide reductase [Roseiflexaceae bacterium]|jgi:thiol-disulfide isomerase/thioredoxin
MNPPRIVLNRRIVLTSILGIAWAIATRKSDTLPQPRDAARPIPSIALQTDTGAVVDFASIIGTPSIITIWASWCPSCRAAMPFWERVAADYAIRGVQVIGINQRESLAVVQRERATLPTAMTIWSDLDGRVLTYLQSTDLPTTAFVTRTGHISAVVRGPVSAEVVTAMLDQLSTY